MFGLPDRKRRKRFELAVAEEMTYLLSLHSEPASAAEAALERSRRPNIGSQRTRVQQEAAARLAKQAGR